MLMDMVTLSNVGAPLAAFADAATLPRWRAVLVTAVLIAGRSGQT
jgi:ABC-type transporter Mla maintaining outer membrane lipid asymmetry permease subunit MlaE